MKEDNEIIMEKKQVGGLGEFFPDPSRFKEFGPKEPLANRTKGRVLFERLKPLVNPNIPPLFK
jgi:hypothetical protein